MPLVRLYKYCDFTLASEICLPEGFICSDTPDVWIRLQTFDADFGSPGVRGMRFHALPQTLYFNVDGVARYLVRNGNEVLIDPAAGMDEDSIRTFLLTTVLASLLLQRNFLVLNGGVANIDGEGVAFLGDSCVGKSTLMAALHQKGVPVFSDELCVVTLNEQGSSMAWQGYPTISIWDDSLRNLGWNPDNLRALRPSIHKFTLPINSKPMQPIPLTRLVELRVTNQPLSWSCLNQKEALTMLLKHSYRQRFLSGMGLMHLNFQLTSALSKQAQFRRVNRPWGNFPIASFLNCVRSSLAA